MTNLKINGVPTPYFGFGGMKRSQSTRLHIISNDGNVLCGVKSNWMEATESAIDENGYLENKKHLFPITDKRSNTCNKCLKSWLSIINKKSEPNEAVKNK